MPFYEFDLTVPNRTPAASPATSAVRLNKGVITGVEVAFPPGCAGLVSFDIWRADFQLWPTNPDSAFKGDGIRITWDEDYVLEDEPATLILRGWAPSARFDHTVTCRIELVSLASAAALRSAPGLLQRIAKFLGAG